MNTSSLKAEILGILRRRLDEGHRFEFQYDKEEENAARLYFECEGEEVITISDEPFWTQCDDDRLEITFGFSSEDSMFRQYVEPLGDIEVIEEFIASHEELVNDDNIIEVTDDEWDEPMVIKIVELSKSVEYVEILSESRRREVTEWWILKNIDIVVAEVEMVAEKAAEVDD